MTNKQLVQLLSQFDNDPVYLYVENEFYYPIKTIKKDYDGNIIIVCKNIKEVKSE